MSDEDVELWCKLWRVTRGHTTDKKNKELWMVCISGYTKQQGKWLNVKIQHELAVWQANKRISERLKGTPACNLDATFRRSESSKSKWEVSRGYIIGIEVAIYGNMCG